MSDIIKEIKMNERAILRCNKLEYTLRELTKNGDLFGFSNLQDANDFIDKLSVVTEACAVSVEHKTEHYNRALELAAQMEAM